MSHKILSIHQPNYIPWIGCFDKISKSDIFVLFDDVQMPRGKSFVTRNKILAPNGPIWLTVPVKDRGKMLKINEVEIAEGNWNEKHWKSIKVSYCKSPFFDELKDDFESTYMKKWVKLCELNVELIKKIMKILRIDSKIVFSSDVPAKADKNERIIEIIKYFNADTYISGKGSGSQRYVFEEEFEKNDIKVIFDEFIHPIYKQTHPGFVPNMSVLDLLFNIGDKAKEMGYAQ
ncbi:WbqC-like family protein [groundwater metagenome]|uniref:WbqC-like family protein n=1 Tax=groundwater metagenome TaxID=717931 RepID=A0A098EEG6_9ZZZZ